MTTAPILRATHVRRPPSETFGLFTDRIGAWWPLVSHGVFGGDSAGVAFEGERLVERSVDGRRAVWAEMLEWEPGRRLVLAWHPGREDGPASRLERRLLEDAELATLAAAYEAFFTEAGAGGFAAPAAVATSSTGDFSAEQVVAHVAVNDDLMSAVCRAVMEGAGHPDGARPPAPFVNDVPNDRAMLDALVTALRPEQPG